MPQFKLTLVGPCVGKTSFSQRAELNTFNQETKPTIGAAFSSIGHRDLKGDPSITNEDQKDKAQVWDTAGQERYRCLAPMYYRGAGAVIVMADFSEFAKDDTNTDLLNHQYILTRWIEELKNNVASTPIYLVATKYDMLVTPQERENAFKKLKEFANSEAIQIPGAQIFITSAKATFKTDETPNGELQENGALRAPINIIRQINQDLNHKVKAASAAAAVDASGTRPASSASAQPANAPSKTPNIFSRFFGLIVGALLGAGTALLIHNPVACFLAAARAPYFAEWGQANWLRILLAPVVNPVMAVLYGLKDGAVFGAQNGVTELAQIPKNENFKLRTVIGSFLVSALIVAAAIAASPLLSLALPIVAGIAGAAALITIASMGVDLLMSARELSKARKINSGLLANTDDARNAAAATLEVQPPRPQPASSQQKGYGWALLNEYKNADRAKMDWPIKENPGQSSQSYRSLRSWVNVAPRPPVTSAEQAQMTGHAPQASR